MEPCIEGRLRNRELETKVDSRKRRRTEVVADRVQFLGASPIEPTEASAIEEPVAPSMKSRSQEPFEGNTGTMFPSIAVMSALTFDHAHAIG